MIVHALIFTIWGNAQELKDLQTPDEPLVLKSQGSFYVGGETVEQSFDELGSFGPGSKITVNQMYVRYMVPASEETGLPVIMIHGMALTGKTWETTPDGRMGWDEYFVRKGHPTYIIDQVARGRSGFDQAILNNIRTGTVDADKMPLARRFADEWVWHNFRMGMEENEPFEDTQFPVESLDELSKQGVPDISGILPDNTSNYRALSNLAIDLDRAVLISHSQSGFFPMQAALVNAEGVAGIVALEPGYCPTNLNEEQLKTLSGIPMLIIFGDYLDIPTGIEHSWQTACEQCETFSQQVNEMGGNAKVVRLADEGIKGNSHMLMQDKNHLEIADKVIKWMEQAIEE
jgi:pimeloyl-ACP methyl ester carboxylesterase